MNYFFWPQRQWPNRIWQTPRTLDGVTPPYPTFAANLKTGRPADPGWSSIFVLAVGRARQEAFQESCPLRFSNTLRGWGKGFGGTTTKKKEGQEGQNPRQPMSNVQCPASISSYAPRLDLMGFRVPQRMCPIPAHPVQFHSVRLLRQIPYSVPVPCSLRRSPSHRLDWLQDFRGICLGPLYVSNFVLFPCPCRWRGARNLYLYFTPLAICWFYGQDLRAWKYLRNKFTW